MRNIFKRFKKNKTEEPDLDTLTGKTIYVNKELLLSDKGLDTLLHLINTNKDALGGQHQVYEGNSLREHFSKEDFDKVFQLVSLASTATSIDKGQTLIQNNLEHTAPVIRADLFNGSNPAQEDIDRFFMWTFFNWDMFMGILARDEDKPVQRVASILFSIIIWHNNKMLDTIGCLQMFKIIKEHYALSDETFNQALEHASNFPMPEILIDKKSAIMH